MWSTCTYCTGETAYKILDFLGGREGMKEVGGGGREREIERKMGRNALKTELIGKS